MRTNSWSFRHVYTGHGAFQLHLGYSGAADGGRSRPCTRVAVDALVAARILLEIDFYGLAWEGIGDPDAHRLSQRVRGMSRGVNEFHRLWGNPDNRLWLAAVIGDWPTANELAALHEDPKVRARWPRSLQRIDSDGWPLPISTSVCNRIQSRIWKFFTGKRARTSMPVSERSIAAKPANPLLAELLLETGDPQWNPQLFAALERLSVEQVGWGHRGFQARPRPARTRLSCGRRARCAGELWS